MSSFIDGFYKTVEWKLARSAYLARVGGLCERCFKRGIYTPAVEVHHIKPLTPESIKDPAQRTGEGNLMALCVDCHDKIHAEMKRKKRDAPRRWSVDKNGRISATHTEDSQEAPLGL